MTSNQDQNYTNSRGTQRENSSSKPHSIVKHILVFKRQIQAYFYPLKIFHLFAFPSSKSSDPKIIGIKTYNFSQIKGSRKFQVIQFAVLLNRREVDARRCLQPFQLLGSDLVSLLLVVTFRHHILKKNVPSLTRSNDLFIQSLRGRQAAIQWSQDLTLDSLL